MSVPAKVSSLQAYSMLLYRTALHPEFFRIEGRRRIEHGEYDFEAWVFRGGHALRFQADETCLSEIVTDQVEHLPEPGIAVFPCAGERDHDAVYGERLAYTTSMQTEVLTDHLYLGTYNEMIEHVRSSSGLVSMWRDELGRPNLSVLDTQRYNDSVHVQAYHLRSDCGLVLRTQSILQVK